MPALDNKLDNIGENSLSMAHNPVIIEGISKMLFFEEEGYFSGFWGSPLIHF